MTNYVRKVNQREQLQSLWVHHYFNLLSLEVPFSKTQELAMAVKDTFGEWNGDAEWPRTACAPCRVACSGHALSNEDIG